jgi:DNA-binding transcriptional MerR regulator
MTVYNYDMNELWKIDELAELVRAALQTAGYDAQQSGRVRGVPDRRTIRYYTTLGLLDKPAEMHGRTAFYGRRHVLQLVAIKKLQAHGLSLLKVQKSLAGADERKLVRWAGLPEGFWDTVPAPAEPKPLSPDELLSPSGPEKEKRYHEANRAGERFWAVSPAAPPAEEQSTEDSQPSEASMSPRTAVHLSLRPGVTLVVEGADWWHAGEGALAELAPALEDFLAALRRAGLVPTDAPQTERNEPHPKHPTEENEEPT